MHSKILNRIAYKLFIVTGLFSGVFFSTLQNTMAGPFPPAAGNSGSTAIVATDTAIVAWASGYINYNVGTDTFVEFRTPEKSLSEAGNSDGLNSGYVFDTVSLGRGGEITLTFDPPITNGSGFDFAVFENSFSASFLELAYVEVSSNGINFFRYPVASLTSASVGPFDDTMDTTNIIGFAGKYHAGYGTPFDLDDIADDPNLDKNSITHVRIIDVIGDGQDLDDTVLNNPIYDPYPTSISAGFDLDAIAVLNQAAESMPESLNVPLPPWIYGAFVAVFLSIFRLYKK